MPRRRKPASSSLSFSPLKRSIEKYEEWYVILEYVEVLYAEEGRIRIIARKADTDLPWTLHGGPVPVPSVGGWRSLVEAKAATRRFLKDLSDPA